ncbi:flagellar hook-length control protein FliK [Sedimenticola sp.]|uniref:flagellar hook-length control protein FliK n=1 Tax=Sedimenticola sp. TaxID=1940285 RepID=UPI003D0DA0C5
MQITDPISNPRLFIEQTRADAFQQLRPGQMVQAVVETQVEKGIAQLNIGGIKVPVKTAMKLEIGQQLALNVVKAGKIPEFKVVRALTPSITQALALKNILPKQLPLNQVLDTLKSLSALQPAPINSGGATPIPHRQNILPALFEQLLQQPEITPATTSSTALATPAAGRTQTGTLLERNLQLIANALQTNQGKRAPEGKIAGSVSELAKQINQVINQAISASKPLTGEAIRQAFNQSGLFLEPHLVSQQVTGTDFKQHLMQLLQSLQSLQTMLAATHLPHEMATGKNSDTATTLQLLALRLFAELHHQAEGALARVQLHQLASLPQDDNSPKQIWQFELPIAHPDGHDEFLIKFEREARQAEQTEDRWSVTLNFNIPPAGPVCARLSLLDDEISSHFTAEFADAAKRIEQSLPRLYEAFLKAGLKIGKLSASQGSAVTRPDQPLSPSPLLDERA